MFVKYMRNINMVNWLIEHFQKPEEPSYEDGVRLKTYILGDRELKILLAKTENHSAILKYLYALVTATMRRINIHTIEIPTELTVSEIGICRDIIKRYHNIV